HVDLQLADGGLQGQPQDRLSRRAIQAERFLIFHDNPRGFDGAAVVLFKKTGNGVAADDIGNLRQGGSDEAVDFIELQARHDLDHFQDHGVGKTVENVPGQVSFHFNDDAYFLLAQHLLQGSGSVPHDLQIQHQLENVDGSLVKGVDIFSFH